MVLVIDNYDSFTYNLVQYLGELGVELQVRRNDEITLDAIRAPVFPTTSSKHLLPREYQSLVFVWGTNALAMPSAPRWSSITG
jgi:hypothetical protein